MVSLRHRAAHVAKVTAIATLVSGIVCEPFPAFADSAAGSSGTAVPPMQFFGFDMGGRTADLQARFAGLTCVERACTMPEGKQSPGSKYVFGEAVVTSWSAASEDGRVGWFSAAFSRSSYPEVIKAMVARYGPPTNTLIDGIQNHGSNEVFDSQRSMWVLPEGLLIARERISNSENGELMMRASWYLTAVAARKQAEFKAQSKPSQ